MFPGPTGTNAVEAAITLARRVTGRASIASFTNSFHGMTLGSLATSGSFAKRHGAGVALTHVDRFPYDDYFGNDVDTIKLMGRLLDDPTSGVDPPAAFLLEVVQGEGGVFAASDVWLQQIADLARRHGSLLVIDDVQAGCGRTGTFFSFERAGLNPDIICLSKALSGYGLPLSMVLIKPKWDIWNPGDYSGTFRGQNYAFVTGKAALNYWHDQDFLDVLSRNVGTLEEWLQVLVKYRLPNKLSLRGRGLIRGIATESARVAANICSAAYQSGILIETSGARSEVVKLLPPLNIEPALLEETLNTLGKVFEEVAANPPK